MLDVTRAELDPDRLEDWRRRVQRARAHLGWPTPTATRYAADEGGLRARRAAERAGPTAIRPHATGVMLALTAPYDQLLTATEINEWALCAALSAADPSFAEPLRAALAEAAAPDPEAELPDPRAPVSLSSQFAAIPPVIEESAALARFSQLAQLEALPKLRALVDAADERERLAVVDDEALTLGSGSRGRTWSLTELPAVEEVDWAAVRDVPAALVTGSNGKTTTVRLIAACARARGWRDGFNCTDGLFVGGSQIASGDYSGPMGTRAILRDQRVEAAVLETARGGILRRGLAANLAHVAVITNVSADHFGEYGIHDLAALADVKFVVASAVRRNGLLVLNADDALLRERAAAVDRALGWFALDYDAALLRTHRAAGGATSGVRDGRLLVSWRDGAGGPSGATTSAKELDLGEIVAMPLTVRGSADYNIANVAGVSLAAMGLGIDPGTISAVLKRFGAQPTDNAGRLMRYDHRGAQVLVDYAHNPDGLAGLLRVARQLRGSGRLALLLGQAGNRATADIEELARTAARFGPDLVVVKETENYLRGRAPGEVPAILQAELVRAGLAPSSIEVCLSELGSARRLLDWARPGDVLVLPVHDRTVRTELMRLLGDSG
jgi:UDP-N-acetylmuramyl tripeptide synthase